MYLEEPKLAFQLYNFFFLVSSISCFCHTQTLKQKMTVRLFFRIRIHLVGSHPRSNYWFSYPWFWNDIIYAIIILEIHSLFSRKMKEQSLHNWLPTKYWKRKYSPACFKWWYIVASMVLFDFIHCLVFRWTFMFIWTYWSCNLCWYT